MFPPREIIQNLVLRTGVGRALARRGYTTGIMDQPEAAESALALLAGPLTDRLAGLEILEIGPGMSTGLMRAATTRGARYSAFDVANFLGSMPRDTMGVDYRTDPDGALPWPDHSFDVVWSYSVLEHIPDPEPTLAELFRVLRPGGAMSALIDLESHAGGRGDPERMYEFLRFPEWLWNAMTSHRSVYVNRLRSSEWRTLISSIGFEIFDEDAVPARCGLEPLRAVDYLADLSDEDLLTRRIRFATRRPGSGHG